MVISAVMQQRPKRMAAVKGVQDAVSRIVKRKYNEQPKSGSLAKPKQRTARRSVVPVEEEEDSDASDASSDLSDETQESDREDDNDTSQSAVDENEEEEFQSAEEEQDEEEDEDEEDDYRPSKKRSAKSQRSARTGKASEKRQAKPKGQTGARKASAKATSPKTKKDKSAAAPKRAKRAPATALRAGRARRGGAGTKDDLSINPDNKLFNIVKNAAESDFSTAAEDWVAYYQDNGPAALAQFMNFVFRSAGCNASIDEVQIEDTENAVDTLEEVQVDFKKQNLPSYPLVSKSSVYRRFRRSLGTMMESIFTAASDADVLDDGTMLDTLIAWISTLTSSPYRALRHTATTIALMMMGQIARLNQEARKQFEQSSKLRDAEKTAKKSPQRIKQLNETVRVANAKRQALDKYHADLDETVFIHRYRDSDPTIRADCMEELGLWMRICPAQFMSGSYFRYLAWQLSDESAAVRLVVAQSLNSICARQQSTSALKLFTERALPRMVEIATGDVDVGVRIAMVNTLINLDHIHPLEDDKRDELVSHIFDLDPKVRVAVARFAANLIEEDIDEDDSDAERLRFKAMGALLSRINAVVDSNEPEGTTTPETSQIEGASAQSRISLAVGALWTAYDKLRDWRPLLELLQVDHSAQESQQRQKSRGPRSGASASQESVQLEQSEEAVLVEGLVTLLQKTQEASTLVAAASAKTTSKTVDEDVEVEMTRDLIGALPKLLNKYKTESNRIRDILQLPKYMKLESYLDFQQLPLYEQLWTLVLDQFQRHSEYDVVERAVDAMASMSACAALSNINETKVVQLRESTVSALKDFAPLFGQLSGERALSEDDLLRLTACASRLKAVFRRFDLTFDFDESQDESEGGAWDILLACAQRAPLNRQDETQVVEDAVVSLALYIMWKTRAVVQMEQGHGKATQAEILLTKRQAFLSLCERILEAPQSSESTMQVQRQVLRHMLDIYIVYANLSAADEQRLSNDGDAERTLPASLTLNCSPATQGILADFVLSETKRFHAKLQDEERRTETQDSQEDEEAARHQLSFHFLQLQHAFVSTISHFIGAIRLGVVDTRHSASMLARFGQLGLLYDACLRVLIESLREVGIHERRANVACRAVFDSLVKAYAFLTEEQESATTFVNLAKMLSSVFVVRGTHLTILHSMDGKAVVRLHEMTIEWIARRLKGHEEDEGTEHADAETTDLRPLLMFKAISNLLVSVQPREAVMIKSSLDRILTAYKVDVPGAGEKVWDALHSYEKRLVTITSKSASVARQIGREANNEGADQPAERSRLVDIPDDEEQIQRQSSPTPTARSRPRPRPRVDEPSTQESEMNRQTQAITARLDSEPIADVSSDMDQTNDDQDEFSMANAELSQVGFDLGTQGTSSSREASQMLFRGPSSQSQSQSQRPSRRARPSQSFAEDDDEDEEGLNTSAPRKRSRRH